ncbi:MAG: chemotaxis protein CheA [Phycisphaerales bacterium]|nr:chemotaxis protein CheA [Phycisphaerales bacterium]
MSINDFDPDILQDFLTESGELLEELESDLVDLEATPQDPELLNQIFRALHTIKGSASFLALTNLVAIAHCSESALNVARNGQLVIGKPEMDLLLGAIDVLKIQFAELGEGNTDLTAADPRLIQQLTILGDGGSLTDTAEPDTGGQTVSDALPEFDTSDGRSVERIMLDSGKLDLIEHMASDIKNTIDQAKARLADLFNPDTRQVACNNLADLFEDIVKTVDFFEIEPVLRLANLLDQATDAIPALDQELIVQLTPRLMGVCELLNEQTQELINQVLITWPTDTLAERIEQLSEGNQIESGILPANADAFTALAMDGIAYGSASTTAEVDSFDSVDSDSEQDAQGIAAATTTPGQAAGTAAKRQAPTAIEQTIRVEVSRLESLMNLVGELVLQKNRIGAMAENVGRSMIDPELIEQMEVTASTLDRVTGDIQLAVMRTRMQPLDKLFGKYPRLIRDLATKTHKQINLEIIGGDTEVDKSVIEELGDPLVHLLRNSADHGIEKPEVRAAAGKEEMGTIKLVAGHEGSHVCVQIIDDGKGLDRQVIGAKAVERGLVSAEQLSALSDEEVFRFILEPGFSTAEQVSDLSGRGVGMDVVRTNIESKLKGGISIESVKGKGTTINITIPLTVAIMPAMMVAVADEVFAIPLTNITEIVNPSPDMLSKLGDEPVIHLRGSVHPLISAQEIFDVPDHARKQEKFVVVIGFNQKIIGLRVTRVIGQQEIVIKPLDGVKRDGPISGATVRNDGGVSLIMDIAELMRISRHQRVALAAHS